MGAKHNLPSLENAVMDSPDRENFDGGIVGGVVGEQFLIVLIYMYTLECHVSKSFHHSSCCTDLGEVALWEPNTDFFCT